MLENTTKPAILDDETTAQCSGTYGPPRAHSRSIAVPNSLLSSPRLQPPAPAVSLLVLQPTLDPTRRAPTMARSDSVPCARGARLPVYSPPRPLARSPAGPLARRSRTSYRRAAPCPKPAEGGILASDGGTNHRRAPAEPSYPPGSSRPSPTSDRLPETGHDERPAATAET